MRTKWFLIACLVANTSTAAAADLAELIEAARVAVVRIEASGHSGRSIGSGFVVRGDGLIATNYHVVRDAVGGTVVFEDGRSLDIAGVAASRHDHDMVLLKVHADGRLPTLPLCKQLPDQGDDVFTFGNPEGLRFVVSRGVVSAIADTFEIMKSDEALATELDGKYSRDATWIQTDAAISGGNSGGPLINMQGEVVGINTWHRVGGQNLNFAGSALTLTKLVKLTTRELTPLPGAPRPGVDMRPEAEKGPLAGKPAGGLKLPTGTVFDFSVFAEAAGQAGKDSLSLPILYPGGDKPFASLNVHQKTGKLHGPCSAHHENGKPMMVGRYDEGNREGNFRWTSAEGDILLDAQFLKGKEHGVVCYYQDGSPALVLECAGGSARWSHRVADDSVHESVEHTIGKMGTASPQMNQLLESYTDFARELRQNEHKIKEMVREIVTDVRKQRAAARGALTTQMMLQRMSDRAAADAALINALRNRSGF